MAEAGGAALVLDHELRVLAATAPAEAILGLIARAGRSRRRSRGEGPVLTIAELPPEIAEPESDPERASGRANQPPPLAADTSADPEAQRLRRALERADGEDASGA